MIPLRKSVAGQKAFQKLSKLQKKSFDAFLITSVPNITFFTKYAGFSHIEREAYLLFTETKQYLFTDGRYADAVLKLPGFTLIEISSDRPLLILLEEVISRHTLQKIGFEAEDMHVSELDKLKKLSALFTPFSTRELRIRKTEQEIAYIKKACEIGDKAFTYILKKVNLGISEKELAFELEFFIRRQGGELSFQPIVAFGKNAATPHHHTGNAGLRNNQFVLFDFGVKYKQYCSDMTRTVFFGKPTHEQKKMYQTVLNAQQKAIDYLNHNLSTIRQKQDSSKTKINAAEIDQAARNHIIDAGYPSIPHSVGHGIGIAVHEAPTLSPKSKDLLQNGMVFSIEPGIYMAELGGVRIEDLFIVKNDKLTQLTTAPLVLTAY